MSMENSVLIINFGSKYTQLIARRVREQNIYCEIHPYHNLPEDISVFKAVILSGSPASLESKTAPKMDISSFRKNMPVLAIGYAAAQLAQTLGGEIKSSEKDEFAIAEMQTTDPQNELLKEVTEKSQVWLTQKEKIEKLPGNCTLLATAGNQPVAFQINGESTYGLLFHPEVFQSEEGTKIIKNFVAGIAQLKPNWTPAAFVENSIQKLKAEIGNQKVVLALSGGVDSSVTAVLLNKAIGENLYCIFVNHGLLRKNEFESVLDQYKDMGLNVKGIDASKRFLGELAGVTSPEEKRKIIGRLFIEVFDEEAHKIEGVKYLGQGTIYPDIIESVSVDGSVAVKSHHNVGGLPERMNLELVEPLKALFKDEVRKVGKELGIKSQLIGRHPFPGPGLGIRIIGDITPEKVEVIQNVDHIFIQGLREEGLYDKIWQAAAILLPISAVGVSNDARTYERVVALRAVNSVDGMTADWIDLPYEFLKKISTKIITEVKGVNRVVYDISSKPPATIEWE